jgi:hypothetical protein
MDVTDQSQSSFQNHHSKTNKTPIQITMDAGGEPEIPPVTKADGYHTKVIQTTLRNYCTAHIRKSIIHIMQSHVT